MKTHNQLSAIATPRRPWLRRLMYLGIVLLPGLIVLVSRQTWHHSETRRRLQESLAVVDRTEPGWHLADIEAAREQIPEEENSARVIAAAWRLLPKNWPTPEFGDLFEHLPPEKQLAAEDFARLKEELENARPALTEARKLVAMPRGRHRLEYKPLAWETLLLDQQETRRIVSLLCYEALRHAQERDSNAALNSCRAAFHAARSLGDEPFAVSQLIRMNGVTKSCRYIERVLAQGEPPPERLEDLQDLLHKEDDFPDQLVIARGERAMLHAVFDAVESGAVPLIRLEGLMPPRFNPFFDSVPSREDFRRSHPTMLAVTSRYVTIARLPMHEQFGALKQFDEDLCILKKSDPVAMYLAPALAQVFDTSYRKHAYLRCLDAALAAERYRREHKQWPQSLDKLCPQFLAAVPLDPFDGEPLRYRRVEDGVIIYSVNSDRDDNKGNLDRENPEQAGVDIGVRLWDANKRRQPPRLKSHNGVKLR